MDKPNEPPVESAELPVEPTAEPSPQAPAPKRSRLPLIILIVVLLVGVGVGGYFGYQASVKKSVQAEEAGLVQQAKDALANNNPAAAEQAANEALQLAPAEYLVQSPAAVALRGQALALQEKYAEALPDLDAALADDPQNAVLLKLRGLAYQDTGKTVEALKDFAASLALNPDQPDLLDIQARAALTAGDLQAARISAEAAGKLDSSLSLPYAFQAEDLYASRAYTQTIAVASQAIERFNPPAFAYRLRGGAYYWMYDLANAKADLDKALELDPNDIEATALLALLSAETNQADDLNTLAERASLQAAKTASGLMAQAVSASYNYDFGTARTLLDEAILLAPERPELYILRSETFTSSVDEAARFTDLDTAFSLAPDLRCVRYAMAVKHLFLYEPDQAEAIALALIEDFPAGGDGYDILTGVYNERYELRKALETVEKGLAAAGESSRLYNARGDVYQLMGKYDEATQDFEKALTYRPNGVYPLSSLAFIASEQGKGEQALAYIQQALELDPDNPMVYLARALIYDEQDKQDLAKADRKTASALDARARWVMLDQANQLLAEADTRGAKLKLNLLEERYPLWPAAKITRGWVMMADDQAFSARTQAETVLKVIPNHPDAHLLIGWIEVFEGNYDLAQDEVDAILSVQPLSAGAYSLEGNIYYAQADAEKAEASFLKAVEIDPRRGDAYFSLGMLHFQQEKNDQAIQDFRNVLKYEDHETAEVMLKSLQQLPEGFKLHYFPVQKFVISMPNTAEPTPGEEGSVLVVSFFYASPTDGKVFKLEIFQFDTLIGVKDDVWLISGYFQQLLIDNNPSFKEGELSEFQGLNVSGLKNPYSWYNAGYQDFGNLYFFTTEGSNFVLDFYTNKASYPQLDAEFDQMVALFALLP